VRHIFDMQTTRSDIGCNQQIQFTGLHANGGARPQGRR
jgi:hypothetical protein